MQIEDKLKLRTDLSEYFIHLTRSHGGKSAKENLISILTSEKINAYNTFGAAKSFLEKKSAQSINQKCVCFTETPPSQIKHLLDIDNRQINLSNYGIAITRSDGLRSGLNPVWYTNMCSSGGEYPIKRINKIIEQEINSGNFDDSNIAAITPFIEQIYERKYDTLSSSAKNFSWEREWRHIGDFQLCRNIFVICPMIEKEEFENVFSSQYGKTLRFLDI